MIRLAYWMIDVNCQSSPIMKASNRYPTVSNHCPALRLSGFDILCAFLFGTFLTCSELIGT